MDVRTKFVRRNRGGLPEPYREEICKQRFGEKYEIVCPCCCDQVLTRTDSSWHIGHINSRSHGGEYTISNLKPICASCNLSMGEKNMYLFMSRYFPENLDLETRSIYSDDSYDMSYIPKVIEHLTCKKWYRRNNIVICEFCSNKITCDNFEVRRINKSKPPTLNNVEVCCKCQMKTT